MKKKLLVIIIPLLLLSFYVYCNRKYTHIIKSQDKVFIQPVFNTIRVSSNCDTAITFVDVETKEEYHIGYLTHGMSDTITLEKGKWYKVNGNGETKIRFIKLKAVND